MKAFLLKIKESTFAVLPILVIVLIVGFLGAKISLPAMVNFCVCTVLLIIGISLFGLGVDISMMKIGSYIGSSTSKSKNIFIMAIISTVVGFAITVAEPDLTVLAGQVPGINSWTIILTVSLGTGIFLAAALLRIMFKVKLKILLGIFYSIILVLCFFVPETFLPLSFDSSGVTTGPISVPFIMSFGLGVSAVRSGKNSQDDSLGLIAMVSMGPIIAVMIMSLFMKTSGNMEVETVELISKMGQIPGGLLEEFVKQLIDVLIIIGPIAGIFIIVQIFVLHLPKAELIKIFIGLGYTYFGIVIFFTGVNVGFMPIGYALGNLISAKSYSWILIPISLAIGASIVFAEPAVHVLTKQVEELTDGIIGRKVILITISAGVAVSVCLSVIRNILGISILWFIVPIVAINLILMIFCPSIFVAVGFDSGGVASGAMATTFIIPFINGICAYFGNNALLFGFGTIALIALTPILCIQILGVAFKFVQNKKVAKESADNKTKVKIIDFDYGG